MHTGVPRTTLCAILRGLDYLGLVNLGAVAWPAVHRNTTTSYLTGFASLVDHECLFLLREFVKEMTDDSRVIELAMSSFTAHLSILLTLTVLA